MALALAVLIAIPLGIYQAVKRNSFGDQAVTSVAFTAYAMPDYLLYLIAIQIFALSFHVFGFEASQSNSLLAVIGDWHDMTLPIACLTLLILAAHSRQHAVLRWRPWPRITSRRPGPRACRSASCCSGTWSATPACR